MVEGDWRTTVTALMIVVIFILETSDSTLFEVSGNIKAMSPVNPWMSRELFIEIHKFRPNNSGPIDGSITKQKY